MSHLRQITI